MERNINNNVKCPSLVFAIIFAPVRSDWELSFCSNFIWSTVLDRPAAISPLKRPHRQYKPRPQPGAGTKLELRYNVKNLKCVYIMVLWRLVGEAIVGGKFSNNQFNLERLHRYQILWISAANTSTCHVGWFLRFRTNKYLYEKNNFKTVWSCLRIECASM